jgi:hypothetical protein
MNRMEVSVKRSFGSRGRRARLPVVVAVTALPVLAGCSSSSTIEYATDAYPSQSLVDLLKRKESPPPAPSAALPSTATAASQPLPASATPPEPPPAAATAAATAPPAAAPPQEADPVAAAYPSVSLIDLLTGARKPAP